MKSRVHPTYKTKHHVQSWAFYDRALVRRGDVTIWLSPAAIETGGEAASLVAKVKELEARRVAIDGELRSSKPVPRLRPEVVEGRLTEWRRLLRQSPTQGRAVLQRVLRGRITFTRKCGGYEFEAPTRFDKLFLGVAVETKREVSYEGTEHIGPEDTFDADYGRLLEAVQNRGKGLASPRGIALMWTPKLQGKVLIAA